VRPVALLRIQLGAMLDVLKSGPISAKRCDVIHNSAPHDHLDFA
jgi:hypothetical protein